MIVLGIDPGGRGTGFALLRLDGSRIEHLRSGTIRTEREARLAEKLLRIHAGVAGILAEGTVDEVAVEDVYQGVNPRTASRIGHVRGVVMLAAAEAGLPVFEYPPNEVKSAVVGNGLASKEQVRLMVQQILSLREGVRSADESDALAVAVCHCHRAHSRAAR
ncbi:MAG: crossover junction endodeoxyribonuclease RuvC [Candidatus Eisenbacteria bacterium]|nr:crossover junction endodeoxyribonuclease RuvC [Candidatus Eisenbacteria bacterium]